MSKRFLAVFCLFAAVCSAQNVQPLWQPHQNFVDLSGNPCAGCSLYSYAAGTSTPLATFTDATGTVQNPNPIILDAAGGANIWIGTSAYKFVLINTYGTTLWTVDQVLAPLAGTDGPFLPLAGGTLTGSVFGPLFQGTAINGTTITGSTINGTTGTFSGILTAQGNLQAQANVIVGAEGVDNYVEILPASVGGSIFYLDNSANSLRIGNGAPGNVPFTYNNAGNLSIPGNFSAATANFSGTVTAPTFAGNATTATALTATPTQCTGVQFATGVAANGNANCGTPGNGAVVQATHLGANSCSPPGSSYATCTNVLTWPHAFADTNYRTTCSLVSPVGGGGGSNSLIVYPEGSTDSSPPTTTTITVIVQNNSSDSGTAAADISCIGVHN